MNEKHNFGAGDYVSIKIDKEELKGTILQSYEKNVVLIKLDSGYNIGIREEDIRGIKIISKAKKKPESKKEIVQKGPGISMIVTGGTISSMLDYETGGVKWLINPRQLLESVPKVSEIVKINSIEIPFMIASENMSAKNWQIIAKKTAELLNKKENHAVIITHGTDTLHYTAAALSFMLQDLNKPVILTYSQRSSDRGSSDAFLNLVCAAHAARSNIAEVMLVGHATSSDKYCYAMKGTKVRKMHTSRRDTFRPINDMPIAKIFENGVIEIFKEHRKRNEEKKVIADTAFEEKTALIKFYPGMKPEELEFFIKNKYKGIIIEATGLGHVATDEARYNLLPVIKKMIDAGIIVCFACQTIYGRLDPFVYSPGRKLQEIGVIFLEDMLPETAYVKLGWLLGHDYHPDKIKDLMKQNLEGEYNPRISEKDFLN